MAALPGALAAQGATRLGTASAAARARLTPAQVGLTAAGLLVITSLFDPGVAEVSQAWRGSATNALSDVGNELGNGHRLLPLAGAAWLVSAVAGYDRARDVAGHAFQSAAAAGLAVTAVKFLVGRARPSDERGSFHFRPFRTDDSAFPSGHAAIAFGLATALAAEFDGRWDDAAFYSAATLTGLARINDNRHWMTDVLAGAAVGVAAGRWVTRGHRAAGVAVIPGGLALQLQF